MSAAGIPELQDLSERTWVLLAVTDLFEAWAIGWPPGGRIELHDHGPSSGAVVVASGLPHRDHRATHRPGSRADRTRQLGAGEHRTFGPRYVHDLTNDDHEPGRSASMSTAPG